MNYSIILDKFSQTCHPALLEMHELILIKSDNNLIDLGYSS